MDKETKFLVYVKLMLFLANLPDKCSRACPPPGWITRLSTAASFTDTVFAIRVNSLLTRRLGLGFQLSLLLFFSCFEMLKLFNQSPKTLRKIKPIQVCQQNNMTGHMFQYVYKTLGKPSLVKSAVFFNWPPGLHVSLELRSCKGFKTCGSLVVAVIAAALLGQSW